MSRNLMNEKKWSPSPDLTIKETEERYHTKAQKHRFIEENDDEDDEQEDSEDDYEEEEEEGDDMSEYSSSPSIPDENINFDLVYTLHTFEATVDGQASVKKGDALTLLDDTNSYWWLIRNLKSSEVGYIPAENIETPFERLARLNKHRNVELTSIEQAAYYTNGTQKPKAMNKKVKLSTALNVQLQIFLTGEDDEDIQDEAFEHWEEEMMDEDDDEYEEEDGEQTNDKEKEHHQASSSLPLLEPKNRPRTSLIECEIEEQEKRNVQTDPTQRISRVIEIPLNFKVIKVYAGNFDIGASYHSVRITESTSVDELLSNTLEKFHISEIETKHGRSYGKNSCVEYYLTVKTRDGDEVTLDSEDKPYAIHESLTAHLTTPMPSLTQFRQLNGTGSSVNVNKRKKKRSSNEQLQFCLHKRIKRINDKNGQVHIKVSLMTTPTLITPMEKTNTIKKMTALLGRSKYSAKKELLKAERIDKLIAAADNIFISDLTSLALVKFHIIHDIEQPHQYKLLLHCDGKERLLDKDQQLCDVLSSINNQVKEKFFILKNSAANSENRTLSKSSSASSSSSSSSRPTKVFPENSTTYPVMTRLDSTAEDILKRVDAALQTFEPASVPQPNRKDSANPHFPSSMSVCRNKSGVDIHLPHGLLRSTVLPGNKTQYSLMKFPNTLVLQKVLPNENRISLEDTLVSGEELATLIKYGTQYLNAYDTAKNPEHHLQLAVNPDQLFTEERDADKSLSSLADLEKELYRIINSHSS